MVQSGSVLCLAPESQIKAGVTGQVGAQHFDGDIAMQPQIAGEVDLRHAAEPDDLAKFVAVG